MVPAAAIVAAMNLPPTGTKRTIWRKTWRNPRPAPPTSPLAASHPAAQRTDALGIAHHRLAGPFRQTDEGQVVKVGADAHGILQ